jgi:hypothetical protein
MSDSPRAKEIRKIKVVSDLCFYNSIKKHPLLFSAIGGAVAQISLWFMGLGFGHASVLIAQSLCLEIGLVFRLNTLNDNDYTMDDS